MTTTLQTKLISKFLFVSSLCLLLIVNKSFAQTISTYASSNTFGIPVATIFDLDVRADGLGNVYIGDAANNRVLKVNGTGGESVFVTGTSGAWGSDGIFLATDPSGNLYISSYDDGKIYKVTPGGTLSTFTTVSGVFGIAYDPTANILYASNYDGQRIDKINSSGTNLGALASSSNFDSPWGIAVDGSGNVYQANGAGFSDNFIYKITPGGTISVFAGTGNWGNAGDGNAPTNANFKNPTGIAFDAAGNAYIADQGNNVIREVIASTNKVATFAGINDLGTGSLSGDGGPATSARLNAPYNVSFDPSTAKLYIADEQNARIRVVCLNPTTPTTPSGATTRCQSGGTGIYTTSSTNASSYTWSITGTGNTVSGTGSAATVNWSSAYTGTATVSVTATNGCGTSAAAGTASVTVAPLPTSNVINTYAGSNTFGIPVSALYSLDVRADGLGNVYIGDAANNRVLKVNSSGTESLFVTGTSGNWNSDGIFLASDPAGNVYISSYDDGKIYKVTPAGVLNTFVSFSGVFGIAYDPTTSLLYASDFDAHSISKINSAGTITTVATSTTDFDFPWGIGVDPSGNVYQANGNGFSSDNFIYKITPAGVISVFAGVGPPGNAGDGNVATNSRLNEPTGISFDAAGNAYIADQTNDVIRKVDAATNHINTFAGQNNFPATPGNGPDGVSPTSAQLHFPYNVSFDPSSGSVYIADEENARIRVVSLAPSTPSIPSGTTTRCQGGGTDVYTTSTVTGATSYTWSVTGSGNTVSGTGTSATVSWSSGFTGTATVSVVANAICPSASTSPTSSLSVVVTPTTISAPSTPSGTTSQCQGMASGIYTTSAVSGAVSYTWSVTGSGNTVSGTSTTGTVSWSPSFIGTATVSVTANGSCGSSTPSTVSVVVSPVPTGKIINTYENSATSTYSFGGYNVDVRPDGLGNVFIADPGNNRILKVNSSGTMTIFVSGLSSSWNSDGIFLATDPSGNVFISSYDDGTIYKYNSSGVAVSAFRTQFNTYGIAPWGIAYDTKTSSLYVSDGNDPTKLYQFNATSGVKNSTISIPGAQLVIQIATDVNGNVYLADDNAYKVWKVAYLGTTATLFAGNGSLADVAGGGDGGAATSAELYSPVGVAADASGNVYISTAGTNRVRVVNTSGIINAYAGVAYTYCGSGCPFTSCQFSGDGGDPANAYFCGTSSVAVDATTGKVYIADQSNGRIRTVVVGLVPPGTPSGSATRCQAAGTNTYTTLAETGATSYTWSVNGSGNTIAGTGTAGTVTWASGFSGTATVSVIANATCPSASSSAASSVSVVVSPTTLANPSTPSGAVSRCQAANTGVYTSSSAGATSYAWSVTTAAGSVSGTGTSATVTWLASYTGTATVSVTASNTCATSTPTTASITVTPNTLPAPSTPSGTASRCKVSGTGVYTIPAVVGATGYTWSVSGAGNSASGTGTSGTVTWGAAFSGTATVSVTANNGGCATSSAATLAVAVNVLPTFTATPVSITETSGVSANDGITCSGDAVKLTANVATGASPFAYAWSSSLGTSQTATVSPTAGTSSYSVTVTDNNGCTATSSKSLTVNALPTLGTTPISATENSGTTSNDGITCSGDAVTLTTNIASGASPFAYSWSGSLGTNATASVSPATGSPSYSVTVTDHNGCTVSASRTLTVNGLPTPSITEADNSGLANNDAIICNLDNATLTANPSGLTYSWNQGLGTTQVVTDNPSTTTAYSVTVTDGNSCTATANKTVTVNQLPPLVVTPNNAVCTGGTTATLVASGASTYTWSPTTNLTPSNGTTATETAQISALTIYTITGTNTSTGCSASTQVPVATVAVGGTISAPFTIICSGGTKLLTVSGAAGNDYQWQKSSDNSTWAIITGATNTTYTTASADGNTNKFYRLLANSNACWNVASTTAEVDVSNPTIVVTAGSITDNNLILNWSPTGTGNYNITYSGASSGLLTGVTPPKTVTGLTADGAYSIVVTQTGLTGCPATGTVSANTLCAVPTNLTATPLTVGPLQELNVSWNGPTGNYRIFYRPLYSAVTFYTKDVTNATSTTLTKQGNNNLYGSNTYQVYVSRLDCPNTGNVGQPTGSIYVTTNPITVVGCATPTIDTAFSTCPVELEVQLHGGSGIYNVYIQRLTPTLQAVNSYGITGGDFVINAAAGQQYLISADSKCGSVVSTLNIWHNTLTVKPTCTSPSNLVLSNPTCHGFTASWNADQCISNTVSGYDLYMRQAGSINFNSYGVALSVAPVGPHELVNWLGAGKNMQVFVQSVYSCGGAVTYGPSSQTVTITTQSAGCRDEEPTDQIQENKPAVQQYSADNQEVFSLYPNPNKGEFTVDLSRLSNNTDEVRIEVINMIGQTLITQITSISDGHMRQFINLPTGTAAGTYIVRLTAGKNVYTAKVNISK